jgi:pimeloyl-ACP methyl ester carboxylesterase
MVRRVVLAATVPGIPSVPGNPLALPGQVRDTPGFGPIRWGHVSQTMSLLTFSNWATMALMRAPTLVMAGDADPVVPLSNSRILARGIPHATLHVVRGGGHLFLLNRPGESARVIDEFLS